MTESREFRDGFCWLLESAPRHVNQRLGVSNLVHESHLIYALGCMTSNQDHDVAACIKRHVVLVTPLVTGN